MAQLIRNGDFITEGERQTAEKLEAELPGDWIVITNKTLVTRNGVAREIDFIVIGTNSVFVVDEKGFRGRIHGNDQYWVFDSRESCDNPLNKADIVAKMLAGVLRDNIPALRSDLGGRPFVVSAVVLSDPGCQIMVQEPRRDRIFLLEDAGTALRKLDRANAGIELRAHRSAIVEKLKLVPPRPSLPRRINLYTVLDELPAGPYYRCFRATHSSHDLSEQFRIKLYEVGPGSDGVLVARRELINRDYRATARLATLGLAPPMEMPMEWADGRYIVVGQRIPRLPTLRTAVIGDPDHGLRIAIRLCRSVLEAVARIHESGVIHRNLSPDNTFVDASRGHSVLFTDFDFARIEDEASVAAYIGDDADRDSRYAAPEVVDSLSRATQRSDIFSMGVILDELISPFSEGIEPEGWSQLRSVIESMVRADPDARWSSAREALDMLNELFSKLIATQENSAGASESPEPGAMVSPPERSTQLLDGRYKVIRTLGEGATAVTYLAEDTEFEGFYVLKRIKDLTLAKKLAAAEFRALRHLPEHPRIVKIIDANPPERDFHLKMEFVDGSSLQDLHGSRAWDAHEVRRLMEQLLEGLDFLERHGIAHRDISPRNVIVGASGPKLIDFGFAAAHDEVGKSNVGTISFRAPELDRGEAWNRTCDLYSAGAIGLWLLLGRLPFARNVDGGIVKTDLILPDHLDGGSTALIVALGRAVHQDKGQRYDNAVEFVKALQAADAGNLVAEEGLRAINPWVAKVQSLYRNSSVGNADNRGLDSDFSRTTYVPTLLDKELLPQVIAGQFAVVLLSGNPGDGKTAFLEMVFDALSSEEGFRLRQKDENGWEVELRGRVFQANYDASESHDGLRSDELLQEIFEPFEGDVEPSLALPRTVLVAINDGKLREFLLHNAKYRWLGREVSWYTENRGGEKPDRVVVVDLKQRSVVGAGNRGAADLYSQMLDTLVDEKEWSICLSCRARAVCPMKFNRDSLASQPGPRVRLRTLFQVSHLRRDRHVTIRDMRSTLSYVIVGESSCDDIHKELEDGVAPLDWTSRLYFAAAFNPRDVQEDNLSEFSLCDPARSTHPRLERRLWHLHRTRLTTETNAWCTTIPDRADEPIAALNRLATPSEWMDLSKRRLYFEGDHLTLLEQLSLPPPDALLPYRSLMDFLKSISTAIEPETLPKICEGISRANGVSDDTMRESFLCVMTSHSIEQDLTVFKRFPISEFVLSVKALRTSHVEKLPNSLTLRHTPSNATLLINLDLFEILMRMNEGYLPGSEELRPFLIDLDQFEARLLSEPAEELLLLEAGRRLHRVRNLNGTIEYMGIVGAPEGGK